MHGNLFYGCGTEGVCCAEIYFLACHFVLVCQFADSGCFANSVYAYYHDYIGFTWQWIAEVSYLHTVVFG